MCFSCFIFDNVFNVFSSALEKMNAVLQVVSLSAKKAAVNLRKMSIEAIDVSRKAAWKLGSQQLVSALTAKTPRLSLTNARKNIKLAENKQKAAKIIGGSGLDEIIQNIISKNKDLILSRGRGAVGPLMGDLMKKVGRGSIDGKILSKKLKVVIENHRT